MRPSPASTLTIDRRFAGPPTSGNGGYTAGLLAQQLATDQPVTVTLRRPPPLDVPMDIALPEGGGSNGSPACHLLDGHALVAEAAVGGFAGDPVAPVPVAVAREAQTSYRGLQRHPFPGCFTCGPDRAEGDGLRLAPGPVAPGQTACVWVPDAGLADPERPELVAAPYAWAALDCPGGWTSDIDARPLVLGRMTAQCRESAMIGRVHVVVARLLGEDGRKVFTTASLYDDDGLLLGRAEHTWIAVDPAAFSA